MTADASDKLEPEQPSLKGKQRRWGCLLSLLIFLGIAAIIAWDLNPVWGLRLRRAKLHDLAPIGQPWKDVEPSLTANGYQVMPGVLNINAGGGNIFSAASASDSSGTLKVIRLHAGNSMTMHYLVRAANRYVPVKNRVGPLRSLVAARFSRIALDTQGKVKRID